MDNLGESQALVLRTNVDLDFIQRNVRDLMKTAQFSHREELEELYSMAFGNLKAQLAPGKPLAEDPGLALEAHKSILASVMLARDTDRKAVDTFIKARVLIDVPLPKMKESILGEEDLPDNEVSAASVGEAGVFGGMSEAADPDMSF